VTEEFRIVNGDATPLVPLLCVVDPDATLEEVAALVAVLLSNPQAPATPGGLIPSEWPVINRLRHAHQVRPRSWRASILPIVA
jgi:hypothetical protein